MNGASVFFQVFCMYRKDYTVGGKEGETAERRTMLRGCIQRLTA